MSDRIGVMFDGRLEQVASPAELYARPCNRKVAAFIGGMNFLSAELQREGGARRSILVPGFGALEIAVNQNAIAQGARLQVGVRPEQLVIDTVEPAGYDATVQGVVADIAFYGESIHYHVAVRGIDRPLKVAVTNYFHSGSYTRGDNVWVGLRAAAVIDLGADP